MEASQPFSDAPDAGHLLFAYGTLMIETGIPAVDNAMRDAGRSLGRGWIAGQLFDLGDYPGAVAQAVSLETDAPDEDAPKVWGHLLLLKDPAALFSVIDPYEGFAPGDLAGSEFVRSETRVFLPAMNRWFSSQVYWYNFPTGGRSRIGSGDYLAHWNTKGKPSQGRIAG